MFFVSQIWKKILYTFFGGLLKRKFCFGGKSHSLENAFLNVYLTYLTAIAEALSRAAFSWSISKFFTFMEVRLQFLALSCPVTGINVSVNGRITMT